MLLVHLNDISNDHQTYMIIWNPIVGMHKRLEPSDNSAMSKIKLYG